MRWAGAKGDPGRVRGQVALLLLLSAAVVAALVIAIADNGTVSLSGASRAMLLASLAIGAVALAVLIPITAWPCGLTAIDGIQSEIALPDESKIVPERDRVGVDVRFASSYQRTAVRVGLLWAVPVLSTPMFWAV